MAMTGFEPKPSPPWLNADSINNTHATAGARPRHSQAADGEDGVNVVLLENILCLSPAAGRRGRQERNRASVMFNSFITDSFQFAADFLQPVAVAARHRVG